MPLVGMARTCPITEGTFLLCRNMLCSHHNRPAKGRYRLQFQGELDGLTPFRIPAAIKQGQDARVPPLRIRGLRFFEIQSSATLMGRHRRRTGNWAWRACWKVPTAFGGGKPRAGQSKHNANMPWSSAQIKTTIESNVSLTENPGCGIAAIDTGCATSKW